MEDSQALACSACGHRVGPSARFCEACGAPHIRRCPNCSLEVPATARFCSSCGCGLETSPAQPTSTRADKLARHGAAVQGERRTVTVLFVDAVESTALAERLGE